LDLGIVTILAAGAAAAALAQASTPTRSGPALSMEPETDLTSCGMPIEIHETAPICDPDRVASIVIRGQFSSRTHADDGFAISFAGAEGRYTTFTDPRGYFEVRIPREDFVGDPCALPASSLTFSDTQMNLQYRLDFE
jgi:hypothetical protein